MVATNLTYLMDQAGYTQRRLARETGIGQTTIQRLLSNGEHDPRQSTIEELAKHFGVTADSLRNGDLRAGTQVTVRAPERSDVRLKELEGFEVPAQSPQAHLSPFRHWDVSEAWLRHSVGAHKDSVRFAVMCDQSLQGEVEIGDIVLVDTSVIDVRKGDSGIFAFTFFDVPYIRYASLHSGGSYQFKGTSAFAGAFEVDGSELEGLKIRGRVVATLQLRRR